MKDGQVIENGAYKELLDLNGSFATMWKKQIFTEVEMVAQAEAVDSGDVIKTLVIEDDSSGSFGNDGGGGESALQEQELEKKADEKIEAKEQPDSTDEAPVYKVDEAGPTPSTHLEFVSTHDDAVEAEPTQDAMAKSGDHPATEANAGEKEEDSHAEPSTSECPSIPSQTSPTVPEPSLTVSNPAPPIEFFVPSGETSVPASSKATSTEPAIATPSNQKAAVPFPSMPRRKTSQSTQSNLSELGSGASTDDVTELTPSDGKDKDKRRKRLSSIKGLVRRISERPGSSGKSPIRELDETTAMLPNRTSTSDTPGGEASDKNKKKQSQKKHRAR
jgi:hypothetical protein